MNRARTCGAIRRRSGFTLVELLVVIVVIGLLAALLLPALGRAMCTGRMGATESLVDNLHQAAKMYELDNNAYPPDGGGAFPSSKLALPLKSLGGKKVAYFEFQPDMLDSSNNIKSRVHDWDTIRYRNNAVNYPGNQLDASAHNKSSIDLWCSDCSGTQVSPNTNVNNWE
ncbi:MAG: prepilin-type N-terminal cleavage/methylation domain-containing protein [Planctomycetes bacterium]|nr:prepilin-type N-terminal cleavage/methylation domain-containing protein [Planctomycetota bacterium]